MEDAFDTFRNQRVGAATTATLHFPGRFICPLCRTEVILASGPIVSKHFRHLRGTDHEECERYSKNFGREVPLSEHEYEHLDSVLVASQTTTQNGGNVVYAVRFRPAKKVGRVKLTGRVEFVSGDQAIPYTIHRGLRGQYFRITSVEKSYLIKAETSDWGHAQYPVEGFDEEPVVFRATEGEGVRIAKHRTLKPGGHIVVSRKELPNFHASLLTQTMQTLEGLHATLIQIPENPSWEVRRNLKSILGFDVTSKLADYGFLSPASVYELAPDCWEVSRDAELAIFIRVARNDSLRFTRLLVQHRLSGSLSSDYLTWNDEVDEFVVRHKPGFCRPDLFRIGLSSRCGNAVSFLLQISFTDEVISPESARIQFQFAIADKGMTRLKWSAHELPKMLIAAARGEETLASISKEPQSIAISVSDSYGKRVTISGATAAEELIAFLHQAKFPCVLSSLGHPDILLRQKKPTIRQSISIEGHPVGASRSLLGARLRDAYKRGHVSKYSISSMSL